MQLGQFFVKISLQTKISDGNGKQRTKIKATGELFQTERQSVVRFTEQIENQADVDTMITIKSGQVTIKRSGGVEMKQQFQPQRSTETIYRHQFGVIRMETLTKQFHYQPLSTTDNAELSIDYITKLDEGGERKHELLLTIEEDKS